MPKARLSYVLHDASRAVRRRFETRAAHLNLTSSQWRLLAMLMRDGPMPQARLAELLEIEPISVSRLVDRMAQANWVSRTVSSVDRRVRLITPTHKAETTFNEASEIADQVYAEAFAGMPENSYDALIAMLEHMIGNLNALPPTPDP
ncbi:MarR family transcriptional regulator [Rhodobacteraceae bacterium]|nr:MarR family transcriptional regulator [Paracoccaceae bacterium]